MPKPSESRPPAAASARPPADGLPDVSGLGYEQARDELVSVVARLEAGAETLEESLSLWERGEALAARCQEWLDGARQRLSAVRDAGTVRDAGAVRDTGAARDTGLSADDVPEPLTPDDIEEQP